MKKDAIDKYIELVYSEDSPLNTMEDIVERKKEAAKRAGLDAKVIQDVIDLKDEKSRKRIFEYLSKTQSNNFITLISDQELFWEMQFRKMTPLKDEEDDDKMMKNINLKTTISVKANELMERIDGMYRRIYKHEPEMKMAQKHIRMLTPEQRIKSNAG